MVNQKMAYKCSTRQPKGKLRCEGLSLIEILVTVLIMALGILGGLSLQGKMQQSGYEAYQRTQALMLLEDIVNRLNTNRASAPCYMFTFDTTTGVPYLGSVGGGHLGSPTCSGFGDANTQALAMADMQEWNLLMQGTNEIDSSGVAVGGIVDARGCISLDDSTIPQTYIVSIAWQGLNETVVPSINCGNNLYGDETRRRVVSTSIQFASLL
ncbi:MAG: type IV pilus modification protein PilV [Pseudomonadales bacterium]|nr:type IV pilus modification protein PilV [Pseudomonadales bacterium]